MRSFNWKFDENKLIYKMDLADLLGDNSNKKETRNNSTSKKSFLGALQKSKSNLAENNNGLNTKSFDDVIFV